MSLHRGSFDTALEAAEIKEQFIVQTFDCNMARYWLSLFVWKRRPS